MMDLNRNASDVQLLYKRLEVQPSSQGSSQCRTHSVKLEQHRSSRGVFLFLCLSATRTSETRGGGGNLLRGNNRSDSLKSLPPLQR